MKERHICKYQDCALSASRQGYCEKHYRSLLSSGAISRVRPVLNREGASTHPLYRCWASMKNRCYNPRDTRNYQWYGGRGIKVCDRWLGYNGFWNFVSDMGERPEGYSIDRIDPNGDYCPENCRWASVQTQSYNRRDNLRRNGKTTIQLAQELGIEPEQVRRRIHAGWGETKLLKTKKEVRQLHSKKVRCVETGKVYNSIKEAATEIGVSATAISSCINHRPKHKTAGGYHWKETQKELEELLK